MPSQFSGAQGFLASPLLASLSPDDQQSYAQLQQRQAIGQALLAQGLQPMDNGSAPVGGMAYHVSPLNGVSKLLNAYVGNKLWMDAAGQQAQMMGQALNGGFGSDQQVPVSQTPSGSAVPQGMDSGSLSGPTAGMGGMQGNPDPRAVGRALLGNGQQVGYETSTQAGPWTIPGMTAAQSRSLYMLNPEEYAKTRMAFAQPTDATRMAIASNSDPVAANAAALSKANYIAPITGTGTFRDPRTMQPIAFNPEIPAGTNALYDASGNVAAVQPIAGAQAAMQGNAAAAAAGGAQFKPVQVYNPQTHQMEYSNEAAVTNPSSGGNGSLPGIVNNNPGNLKDPKTGQFMTFASPQDGIAAADQNLLGYQTQHGINTLNGITARWAPKGDGNNDPAAYAQAVSQATGIAPDQKIDLTNPAVRGKVLQAMFDVETPGWRGAGGVASATPQGAAPRSGPMAAEPPLGQTAGANATATGQVDTMQQSYKEARQARSTGQNALSLLDDMSSYAQSKTPALANKLFNVQGIYSGDAQLFEKARDNLISQVSSATGMNTDAARSIVEGAIPSYGMNPQALQTGLGQIKSQVQMRMLKGDYLADAYANGNAPAYNQRENQFDQMMTPTAAGIIKLPAGPARNAAIASAKGSPQDAQALRWALSVGLLR